MRKPLFLLICLFASTSLIAQSKQPDWTQVEAEAFKHFQAIVRMDTTPPELITRLKRWIDTMQTIETSRPYLMIGLDIPFPHTGIRAIEQPSLSSADDKAAVSQADRPAAR